MFAEGIAGVLWDSEIFQNVRGDLEKSRESGWLRPIRERVWESSLGRFIIKPLVQITSNSIDGAIVGLAAGALLGGAAVAYLVKVESWIMPRSDMLEIVRANSLKGFCRCAQLGALYGSIRGVWNAVFQDVYHAISD